MVITVDDITDVVRLFAPELFPRFSKVVSHRPDLPGRVGFVIVWGLLPNGDNSEEEAVIAFPADVGADEYAKAVLDGVKKLVTMVSAINKESSS